MAELLILPTQTAVRRRRRAALLDRPALLGRAETSLGALIEEIAQQAGLAPALGKVGREELVRLALAESNDPELVDLAHRPGGAAALGRVLERLSAAGPDRVWVVDRLREIDRPRPIMLAKAFEQYCVTLDQLGVYDTSSRGWAALEALNHGVRPKILRGVDRIRATGVDVFTPLQLHFLIALAGQGLAVVVEPPFVPGADEALENLAALRSFERLGSLNADLELLPRDLIEIAAEPIRPLLAALAGQEIDPAEVEPDGDWPVVFNDAPDRYREIESALGRVRGLLDHGVEPNRIGLVCRSLAGLTGQMIVDASRRYNVPVTIRRGDPLAQVPLVRALMALLKLAESGLERTSVLQVADNDYLKTLTGQTAPAGATARLILEAGLNPGRVDDWARLDLAVRRTPEHRRREMNQALTGLKNLFAAVAPLTGRPTGGQALDLAVGLVEQLDYSPENDDLARQERTAANAFVQAIDQLRTDLTRIGRLDDPISPARLIGLIESALAGQTAPWPGRNRAGVQVLRLEDVRELRLDHLILLGLNEGEWPPPPPMEPLVSDQDKIALNRALEAETLFTTATGHYGREKFLFTQALAAARRTIVLSHHRTDNQGRPVIPSSLINWLTRRLPPEATNRPGQSREAEPAGADVLTEDQLMGAYAGAWSRGQGKNLGHALAGRPGWADRMALIKNRAEAERLRDDYFLDPDRSTAADLADNHVGRLGRAEAIEAINRGLTDLAELRLSQAAVEAYANCPFRFFGATILDIRRPDFPGPEPDPLANGLLIHELLHQWHRAELAAGVWPPTEQGLVDVVDQATAAWRRSCPFGHPELSRQAVDEAVAFAQGLIPWEEDQAGQGWRPWLLEKTLPDWSVDLGSGRRCVFKVRLDRVDRRGSGPNEQWRLVDYKFSSNEYRYNKMIGQAGETAFQLPVYLSALMELPEYDPKIQLSGFYLIIKKGKTSKTLTWDQDRAGELVAGIRRIIDQIGRGRFRVEPDKPGECANYCGLLGLCRYRSPLSDGEAAHD